MIPNFDLGIIEQAMFKNDYELFAKARLKIRDSEGVLKPFIFNMEQRYVNDLAKFVRSKGRPLLFRIFKARKRGMSTWAIGDMYWTFQFSDRMNWGDIYGHELKASGNLFSMVDIMYSYMPDAEKPKKVKDTQRDLEFENGTLIRVNTVGAKGEGRSGSPTYVILTEVSSYGSNASSVIAGILSGVKIGPHTAIIQESTSRGYDSFWEPAYSEGKELAQSLGKKHGITVTHEENIRGETLQVKLLKSGVWPMNAYLSIFIPWFWNPENVQPVPEGFEDILTDYEKDIRQTYHLSDEQMSWYVYTKALNCQNDPLQMRQEYPCSPEESFISSGCPVFDQEKITKEINTVESKIKVITDVEEIRRINSTSVYPKAAKVSYQLYYDRENRPIEKGVNHFTNISKAKIIPVALEGMRGNWVEFMPPEENWINRYVLGVDCAEGLRKSDADTIAVFDRQTFKWVAFFRDKVGEIDFPYIIAMAATRYNYADVLVEHNSSGNAVLVVLTQLYPNVLREARTESGEDDFEGKRFGIKTTTTSKARMIGLLKDYVNVTLPSKSDGTFIPFVECLEEFRTYSVDPDTNRMSATGVNNHDDLLMAMAISLEGNRLLADSPPRLKKESQSKPKWLTKYQGDVLEPSDWRLL